MPTIWDELRRLVKDAEQLLRDEEARYAELKSKIRDMEKEKPQKRITDGTLRGVRESGGHLESAMASELLYLRAIQDATIGLARPTPPLAGGIEGSREATMGQYPESHAT